MSIPNSFRPVCRGLSLPPGYTPREYVQFDGNTALDTETKIATPCWFVIDFQATAPNLDQIALGWRINGTRDTRVGIGVLSNETGENLIYFGRGTTFPVTEYRLAFGNNRVRAEARLSGNDVYYAYNREPLRRMPEYEERKGFVRDLALSSNLHMWLGGANIAGDFSLGWQGKVYRLQFKDESGQLIADIVPAMHNGAPCMYDVIRKFELATIRGTVR